MIFRAHRRAGFYFRLVGSCVFLAAFFLPAITTGETGPFSGPQPGFVCAFVAILFSVSHLHGGMEGVGPEVFPFILSGWVNPLVLIYLVFCIWPRFVWVRRCLTVAILLCIGATWLVIEKGRFIPLIGHYLWIAGILAMLAPEVAAFFIESEAVESPPLDD